MAIKMSHYVLYFSFSFKCLDLLESKIYAATKIYDA